MDADGFSYCIQTNSECRGWACCKTIFRKLNLTNFLRKLRSVRKRISETNTLTSDEQFAAKIGKLQ